MEWRVWNSGSSAETNDSKNKKKLTLLKGAIYQKPKLWYFKYYVTHSVYTKTVNWVAQMCLV